MSIVAMESQCMKTIMIYLVDKSDFILSDHKTLELSLQSLWTVIFLALSLPSRKFQSVLSTNLTKKLPPYFAGWSINLLSTCCIIFIPELLKVFEIFLALLKNREEFTNWLTRVVTKKFMFTTYTNIADGFYHQVPFTDFEYHPY